MNGTTARELLKASLLVGIDDGAVNFDDDRYIDWSTGDENGRYLEIGDGSEAAGIDLSWSEIERLQRALTLLLLNRD